MFPTSHNPSQKSSRHITATALFTVVPRGIAPLSVALGLFCSTLQPVQAIVQPDGAAVTVTPGGDVIPTGLRVAVLSATDTAGDTLTARRALLAANMAISRTRGYVAVPQAEVARAMTARDKKNPVDYRGANQGRGNVDRSAPYGEPVSGDVRIPIDTIDYRNVGKAAKAQRALSVFITRGPSDDASSTVSAVVEMYDTKNGGIVGRGEGTFTATVDTPAADAAATGTAGTGTAATNRALNTEPVVNGMARTVAASAELAQVRALGGAIYRAVAELNRPAETRGIVVSIPEAYRARISMGERAGLRNGARLEYVINGEPVAYGTVVSAAMGESVATVAPESAFPNVFINMEVRNVSNPVAMRMGKRSEDEQGNEFRDFENSFTRAAVIAGLASAVGAIRYITKKAD